MDAPCHKNTTSTQSLSGSRLHRSQPLIHAAPENRILTWLEDLRVLQTGSASPHTTQTRPYSPAACSTSRPVNAQTVTIERRHRHQEHCVDADGDHQRSHEFAAQLNGQTSTIPGFPADLLNQRDEKSLSSHRGDEDDHTESISKFRRRSRHKTRHDRYETRKKERKPRRVQSERSRSRRKPQSIQQRCRSGKGAMDLFAPGNIMTMRTTVRFVDQLPAIQRNF